MISVLRKAFDMFDKDRKGVIHTNMVSTILRTMGQTFEERDLKDLIEEIDTDGKDNVSAISKVDYGRLGFEHSRFIGTGREKIPCIVET